MYRNIDEIFRVLTDKEDTLVGKKAKEFMDEI